MADSGAAAVDVEGEPRSPLEAPTADGTVGAEGGEPAPAAADEPVVATAEEPEVVDPPAAAAATAPELPPPSKAVAAAAAAPTPEDDISSTQRILAELPASSQTFAIRFTVRPEGFQIVELFPPQAPGVMLYSRLEKHFRVQKRNMRLYWEGRPIADLDVVADVCAAPEDDQPLMLDLEFDVLPHHLRIMAPGERAVRTVEIDVAFGDDVPAKKFFLTLVKGFERKPFLGGYRDKRNDCTYHHAATQTYVEKEQRKDLAHRATRMTQTQGKSRSCQTQKECATQMARSDLLVDTTYDRVVVAKPYFSADDLAEVQSEKAVKLQAFVRGWRARNHAAKLREERDAELTELQKEDRRRRELHAAKRQRELQQRMHPRTARDFQVLHNELEAWRVMEVQRIAKAPLNEAERRLAMQELLKKETKLLQTIDRLQIQAAQLNRAKTVSTRLETMASAKQWGTASVVQVETPFTVRAKELRDLYNGLLADGLTIDERLDILLHVKWTVKEFDCPLTREIVELIDREADLLNRGRREDTVHNLRKRVANLFLQFVETPEFNPEALQLQSVPLEFKSRPLVQLNRK